MSPALCVSLWLSVATACGSLACAAQSPGRLQPIIDRAADAALTKFAGQKLLPTQLAITLVDLNAPGGAPRASVRGAVPIYPASVIKLFYLAATHRWLEDGKLTDTPELRRAMKDMIVDSSNDATHYLIDLLTETTSGPACDSSASRRLSIGGGRSSLLDARSRTRWLPCYRWVRVRFERTGWKPSREGAKGAKSYNAFFPSRPSPLRGTPPTVPLPFVRGLGP